MIETDFKHLPETQDIIDKVGVLINQLKNTNLNGHALCDIETKLVAYYAYLGPKSALYQTRMNSQYWIRKIAYSKEYTILRNKFNQGDSKVRAEEEIDSEINAENLYNFRFEHIKMVCKGIDLNLRSIAHRLNQLKIEAGQNGLPNQ